MIGKPETSAETRLIKRNRGIWKSGFLISLTVGTHYGSAAATESKRPVVHSLQRLLSVANTEPSPSRIGEVLGLPIYEDARWLNQSAVHRDATWQFPNNASRLSGISILRELDDGNGHFNEIVTASWSASECITISALSKALEANVVRRVSSVYEEPIVEHYLLEKTVSGSEGRSSILEAEGAAASSCVHEAQIVVDGPAVK